MTTLNDSAEVRTGEELDLHALHDYLRDHLPIIVSSADSSTGDKIQIEQFPGGHSNLTYLIRYCGQDLVLRRPPMGPVAPTAHDMPREFKLLSVINPEFPLAPRPLLLCEDASVIGAPFYLMERRHGSIVRSQASAGLVADRLVRRELSAAVVDTLAALHSVDIEASGIVNIGKPAGFVERQVRGWAERWQRAKTSDLPEMEEVISWLTDRIPRESQNEATIVHNDFKLDNLMLDVDDPTRVVAVLDWEMCTVGDPLIDLGLALTYWTMAGGKEGAANSSLRAITNGPGWFTREEFISRYRAKTGRDLSRIVFYETFARFKVAVVIQQIYFRFVKGQTTDERFRNFDQLVSELTREALVLAHETPFE